MKRTGIFFTYFQGNRLRDFPDALEGILDKDNVFYYDACYEERDGLNYLEPISRQDLIRVHSWQLVQDVELTEDFDAALYSASGSVRAAEEISAGHIDNAFVFTSFGDHHAGRDFNGGMCYFNGAALAIEMLRDKGARRFAIVDTDAHHADGTRDIFADDENVLHVCFCYRDYADAKNKVDVLIPSPTTDVEYLAKIRQEFVPHALAFRPEYIFWEYGYDATLGEYADKGLSPDFHAAAAKIIKETADKVCGGRLVVVLCGGSRRDIAAYTIPRIISCLAGLDSR